MSPRVSAGTETGGMTGKAEIIADRLIDKVLDATEWRPEALRVVFKVKGNEKQEVNWAIPIESPDLRPFTSNVPQGEPALRRAIEGMLDTHPRWARVYNGFVDYWMPPPGTHIGTLDNIRQGGDDKIWSFIRLRTRKGLMVEFPAGWSTIEKRVGDTPAEDWIGPEEEFSSGKSPFYYLCQLGLDWKRWTEIELEEAVALFPGHYDQDGRQIAPYFEDIEDWSLELLSACKRHGLKFVQFNTEIHATHSLSVTKPKYFFELIPVIVEGSPEDTAYQAERAVFYEMWDNVTKVVYGDDARFATLAEEPTEEHGVRIVLGLIKPVIMQKPEIVKLFVDGEPKARFPVEREDWRTNGLVLLDLLAERLMKNDACGLRDAALLEWVTANMPELKDDLTVDEGVEF